MLDENQLARLRGATHVAGGDEVGAIDEVYAHSSDDVPAVVAVALPDRRVLVPVPQPEASIAEDRVAVPFDAATVSAAPEAGADAVADEQLTAVYEHFGISDATMREDTGLGGTGRADQGMSRDPRGESAADDATQGHP
jgi:hypothetical protein